MTWEAFWPKHRWSEICSYCGAEYGDHSHDGDLCPVFDPRGLASWFDPEHRFTQGEAEGHPDPSDVL